VEPRRLQVLLELSRRGSMRAVAEHLGTSTSTVSQQVAALAREAGTTLIEPDGRRVRLTPAGRRLADHAVTILAAVEAARADLDPKAEPAGTVRISSFATAIRKTLLPIVIELAASHPKVNIVVSEFEPAESLDLLATDDTDLALAELADDVTAKLVEAGPRTGSVVSTDDTLCGAMELSTRTTAAQDECLSAAASTPGTRCGCATVGAP
jgi:DNA-binding transcriptional LysR family regulator